VPSSAKARYRSGGKLIVKSNRGVDLLLAMALCRTPHTKRRNQPTAEVLIQLVRQVLRQKLVCVALE